MILHVIYVYFLILSTRSHRTQSINQSHKRYSQSYTRHGQGEATNPNLAFTRYCFTSSRLCTSQSSFHSSGAPALPTLSQYDCTTIGQYTTPPRPPFGVLYTIQYW